jgi:hypothetical protein
VVGIPVPSTVPTVGTSPSFSELTAVSCGGQPSAARIIAILRDQHMIGRHDTVSVQVGPLCAGTWQYTVVTQSGREPLQVVTRNVADQLQLVTAGTDVCTITVTTEAPTGIRAITHC